MITEGGLKASEVARLLSIPKSTIAYWIRAEKKGRLSDRGSQYCSHEYMKMLNRFSMIPSMSRKGNCYDNAPIESLWGTLKNELIYQKRYATREEAIREITEYIEILYNR